MINSVIQSISSNRVGDDFWVISTKSIGGTVESSRRPFIFSSDDIVSENASYCEDELNQISNFIGYRPLHEITFLALSNSDVDHRILGEIVFYLTDRLNGFIDFGGAVFSILDVPRRKRKRSWLSNKTNSHKANWADISSFYETWRNSVSGRIYSIEYEIEYEATNNRIWAYHISDSKFLEYWMTCDNFRMIK